MNGVLPKEQGLVLEKICRYVINRYQNINSCDLISSLVNSISNTIMSDEFPIVMMTTTGQIEITNKQGEINLIDHCYNYLFYKDDVMNFNYIPESVIIVDCSINQFKYISDEIPNYLISNFKDMPKNIKYKPTNYDMDNVNYNKNQLEKVAQYILNNPIEEMLNIDETNKQDLFINKSLYI